MGKKKDKNTKLKKAKKIFIILLLSYIVIGKVYSLFTKETSSNNEIKPATSEAEYLIVSECLSNYINALNSGNANDIMDIYEYNFKQENNITIDNVLEINKLYNILFFRIDKLYVDNNCYYAEVTFYSESSEQKLNKNVCELTIQFYKNNTFTIEPHNFKNLVQGE